jgi:hypothetical protein
MLLDLLSLFLLLDILRLPLLLEWLLPLYSLGQIILPLLLVWLRLSRFLDALLSLLLDILLRMSLNRLLLPLKGLCMCWDVPAQPVLAVSKMGLLIRSL